MIAYQADWICPATTPPVRDGWLAVEKDRIVSVGTGEPPQNAQRVEYPRCAILPGFVNAHAHLELTLFHGLLENLSFSDWIARLVRMKYQMCTRDALKASARLGAAETLRAGVTTVGEVMDVGTGWEAMLEFGLQGVAYQEVFGPAEEAAGQALRGLQEKVDAYRKQQSESQRIGVSPHAPYTVSAKLYTQVGDYARSEGLRMTAHIAESRDETLFVREGDGPFAEAHRKRGIEVVARACGPVVHLDRLGLLGPDMLLIHAVETDSEDLTRIRESGSFVVHCPRSNAYLGHRVAPVAAMRARGIPVALGTDSVASNDTFDMFGEMRAVVEQQKLSCDEAFRMATIGGAQALGLEAQLGSLEAGKRADFVVVGTGSETVDPVGTCVRSGDVRRTFLGGREVVMDLEELRRDVENIRRELRRC